MSTIMAFIQRHPLPAYFALTFALSWGGLLLVVGRGGFTGATEPTPGQLPFVFLTMFAGPAVAGLLLTGLVEGKAGFRELRGRLFRWQVDVRWYAVAVLTAPFLILSTLLALSVSSPAFVPGVFESDTKASLLLAGIVAGLLTGVFEELGWTGFAVPRWRRRAGVLSTGLFVGMLWGAWHLPLFSGGDPSGAVPRVLFVPGLLLTVLPAFRVLMVWIHDRTGSLLVVMLMHASLSASTLILQPRSIAGAPALIYNVVVSVALWMAVAAVSVAGRRQHHRGAVRGTR